MSHTTNCPVAVLELDLQEVAGVVHEAVEILSQEVTPMLQVKLAMMGVKQSDLVTLLASWDTLVQADPEFEESREEALTRIHEQVDSVLNGNAVVTIKPFEVAPADEPKEV
jgi:hypothetical protein